MVCRRLNAAVPIRNARPQASMVRGVGAPLRRGPNASQGIRFVDRNRGFPQLALRASKQAEMHAVPGSPKRELRECGRPHVQHPRFPRWQFAVRPAELNSAEPEPRAERIGFVDRNHGFPQLALRASKHMGFSPFAVDGSFCGQRAGPWVRCSAAATPGDEFEGLPLPIAGCLVDEGS
jgi:hypothetical protein